MEIDRQSAAPLYRQIADQLREGIREGRYEPDRPLPSETDIAAALGVARKTVRQAVRVLADEGLVTVVPGRGVFVSNRAA